MKRAFRESPPALAKGLRDARRKGAPVGLNKTTSNLFRRREQTGRHRLDVRTFDRVLRIDPERMTAEVEG